MNAIRRKLRSRRGSSMILALVFMVFCIFVGSSVLAVSTANSSRLKHMTEEQQRFLSQRSAVRLMQDALTKNSPPRVQLSVHVITTVTQEVRILPGGGVEAVGEPVKSIRFSFSAPTNEEKPAVQRLVYESAILRVMDMHDYNATLDSLSLTNLTFTNLSGSGTETLSGPDDFWLTGPEGNLIQITDPQASVIDAQAICEGGDDPYHFWVTFGDSGQDAQISMQMQASVSQRPSQEGAPYFVEDEASGKTYRKTDSTSTVTIAWTDPEIVKGGID